MTHTNQRPDEPKSHSRSLQTRFGDTLLALGLISPDQLHIALQEQQQSSDLLGRQLVRLGFLAEETLRRALAHRANLPEADLTGFTPDPATIRLIPEQMAKRHRMIPLHFDEKACQLTLAIANPDDIVAFDALRTLLPLKTSINVTLGCESEIIQALDHAYSIDLAVDAILSELDASAGAPAASSGNQGKGHPVVRLLEAILADASRRNASDIHFEPEAGFLRLRYRIDGLLRQIRVLHRSLWNPLSVRIKILADLNIAETRAPQDGRFSMTLNGRDLDFRVSSQPTIHGECLVLRLLDRKRGVQPLEALGLEPRQLAILKRSLTRPEGIFVLTGPTGSGKTTTLYSMLQHLRSPSLNIMTLEDPVEYPMELVRQTAVSEACKLDFAGGIRSMMRQDPDVILIGEIRDAPAAEMAFRAAMTGHQVFATLHCNSALGAIPRLANIGIDPSIMAGNIIAIVAQRLVRKICPHCRQARQATEAEQHTLAARTSTMVFETRGCPRCDFTGYKGRAAVTEVLKMTPDLDELVANGASRHALFEAARSQGFRTLAEDGMAKVLAGVTTHSELARVVDLSDLQSEAEV